MTYGSDAENAYYKLSNIVLVQRYITAWRLQNWPHTTVTTSSWFYSDLV